MEQKLIFIPVLAHMLLVFSLFIRLKTEKTKAMQEGQVDFKKVALNPKAWPDDVVKVSNNIANQFETPVLFYGLSFIYFATNTANSWVLGLMFLYVLSRCLHSYFHITRNYVPYRFKAFLVGMLILIGLTIWQMGLILMSVQ